MDPIKENKDIPVAGDATLAYALALIWDIQWFEEKVKEEEAA